MQKDFYSPNTSHLYKARVPTSGLATENKFSQMLDFSSDPSYLIYKKCQK